MAKKESVTHVRIYGNDANEIDQYVAQLRMNGMLQANRADAIRELLKSVRKRK